MSIVTTIARGDDSHVTEPRRVVCRTPEEWRTLWATHAGPGADTPPVDMTAVTVAAAFAGEKPSAGHSVEISAADPAGRGIGLVVAERGPEAGGVSAQIMTSPFHIVSVPRAAGDVSWVDARASRTEDRHVASSATDARSSLLDPRPD